MTQLQIKHVTVVEFDTEDEETEDLLDKQYGGSETLDIPELSQPPVNRSSQVSATSEQWMNEKYLVIKSTLSSLEFGSFVSIFCSI